MTSSAPNILRFTAAASQTSSAAASPRLPGLDWLRAAAALAVVALHAGLPYMTHPLPALEWCVRSEARSSLVDALCWAINGAIMPTFFLMGGSLAAGIWKRQPDRAFLVHRTRRLLGPLLFAVFVVLPADMYVWLIGWYTQGMIPWRKVVSIKLASPLSEQFWGVAHLWYLECLWTVSLLAVAVLGLHAAWRRRRPSATAVASTGAGRSRWWLTLPFASGLILASDPTFLIGFQQTWWPGPAAIAYYGLFFAAGWTWAGRFGTATTVADSGRAAAVRLALAAAVFVGLLPMLHRHVESPARGTELVGLTTLFSLYGWLVATGLLGLARSFKAHAVPSPVAYVAEASFWMYLVHHPLVGLAQLALLHTAWPAGVKFTASLATGVWLSLATYGVFVRGSWIGRLLDGRGRSVVVESIAPAVEEPMRRAA